MSNQQNQQNLNDATANSKLPMAHAIDVEFSMELADEDDVEALERAEAADKRQENT